MKARLIITTLCIFGFVNLLSAQEYRPFRVGIGLGIVPPLSPGFLLYLEPSLRLNKNLVAGVRVETVGRAGNADVGILGSYTGNIQYYVTSGPTRLFFGLGVGAYTTNAAPLASTTATGEDAPKKPH